MPNLANTLYFRMLDQGMQKQQQQREDQQKSADIISKYSQDQEESKDKDLARQTKQAEMLGRLSAIEGGPQQSYTEPNLDIAARVGRGEETASQLQASKKSQLLRDLEAMKEQAALGRQDKVQNAVTDRLGMQLGSNEDIAASRNKGANYRASLRAKSGSQAKPPAPFDPKYNPFVRKIQDNEAKMGVYGKMLSTEDVSRIEQENAQLWAKANDYVKSNFPDYQLDEDVGVSGTQPPVEQTHQRDPFDELFDEVQ